jgi:hypothetical protein
MARLHNSTAIVAVPAYADEGDSISVSVATMELSFTDETAMQNWLLSLRKREVPGLRLAQFLVEDEDQSNLRDEIFLDKVDDKTIAEAHKKAEADLDEEDRNFRCCRS